MPVHSYSGSTPAKNTGCYPPADGLSSPETLHCSQRSSIVFYWYVETSTVMLKSVFRHLILIILAFALVSCTSLPSIATQKRSIRYTRHASVVYRIYARTSIPKSVSFGLLKVDVPSLGKTGNAIWRARCTHEPVALRMSRERKNRPIPLPARTCGKLTAPRVELS